MKDLELNIRQPRQHQGLRGLVTVIDDHILAGHARDRAHQRERHVLERVAPLVAEEFRGLAVEEHQEGREALSPDGIVTIRQRLAVNILEGPEGVPDHPAPELAIAEQPAASARIKVVGDVQIIEDVPDFANEGEIGQLIEDLAENRAAAAALARDVEVAELAAFQGQTPRRKRSVRLPKLVTPATGRMPRFRVTT
jgi:hypothetical protein